MMAAASHNKKAFTAVIAGHSLSTLIHIQVNQQREKILFMSIPFLVNQQYNTLFEHISGFHHHSVFVNAI